MLSIWDDHDYGGNDDGAENNFKTTSEQIFLDFWRVLWTASVARGLHLWAPYLRRERQKAAANLLDTRYFRGKLTKNKRRDIKGPNAKFHRYKPNQKPTQTVLGEAQWSWLRSVCETADVTIIASRPNGSRLQRP